MNKNTFINAMTQIDDSYIDEIMEKRARLLKKTDTRKPVLLMRVMPIAAAVAILATCVIATFSMANRNKPEVPGADDPIVVPPVVDTDTTADEPILVPPVVDTDTTADEPILVPPVVDTDTTTKQNQETEPVETEPEHTNTIVDGAFEIFSPDSSKMYSGAGLVNGTGLSYYLKNESIQIMIDFGFSQSTIDRYVTSKTTGYPKLKVYNRRDTGTGVEITINGKSQEFTKSYSIGDIEKMNIRDTTTKEFRSEILEIIFPELKVGDLGIIVVQFGMFYEETQQFSTTKVISIYYIAGENGIGISFDTMRTAKENLAKVEVSIQTPETITPNIR